RHFQGLCADGTRGAENRYLLHWYLLLLQKYNRQNIDDRRCENHAVKPVQNSPMAGYQMSIILDVVVALDSRCRQVAHLGYDGPHCAEQRALRRVQPEKHTVNITNQSRSHDSANGSLNGLF